MTIDLGSSIALGRSGALLCYAENPATCFVTNNTYSDGPAACAQAQPVFAWLDSGNGSRGFTAGSGWHIKSSSVGMIEQTTAQYVTNVPDATTITAVVNDGTLQAPGANDYEVVFAFAGAAVTFTSVTPL